MTTEKMGKEKAMEKVFSEIGQIGIDVNELMPQPCAFSYMIVVKNLHEKAEEVYEAHKDQFDQVGIDDMDIFASLVLAIHNTAVEYVNENPKIRAVEAMHAIKFTDVVMGEKAPEFVVKSISEKCKQLGIDFDECSCNEEQEYVAKKDYRDPSYG